MLKKEESSANLSGSDGEAALEKRMEAMKVKEQRVAKKDKELTSRLNDLDRRASLIQEVEEKQGAILTREAAVESQQKEVNLQLREVRKRDKICKEIEAAQSETEDKLFGKETYLNSQEKELQTKQAAVAERERAFSDMQFAIEDAERRVAERRKVVERLEADVAIRIKGVEEREKKSLGEKEKVIARQAEVKAKAEALQAKDVELNRANETVKQRNKEITQKETEVTKERDRLNKRGIDVSELETRISADNKNLQLKKEEMARRVAHVEESEHDLKLKTEAFRVMASETNKKRDVVEKHVVENRKYEEELNSLKQELRVQETDLRGRERRLTGLQREHSDREQVLAHRDELLRSRQEELRNLETECARREKDVGKREDHVESFHQEVKQLQERCQQKEEAMSKRQYHLEKQEKDLVEWMKEMEWREMMLGDREAVVDREPVTLPSTANGSTSAGFSNKAFGHAMCEVQLRRLKDLYVSAQMKHAREEIRTGKTAFQKHARLPRAGIAATLATEDVGQVVSKASALQQRRENVHNLGNQFKRLMSRHRAFDSFEDLASPERLSHLEHFSSDERTVLCMSANMEYTLHSQEHLLVKLQRSPLDEKDKAVNVQDLVNRISRWWRKTEEHVNTSLNQLLKDRERYLQHSVAILATKTEVLPSMIKERRGTVAEDNEQASKSRRKRESHSDNSDSDQDSGSADDAASASDQTPDTEETSDSKPYVATTAFGHVKESKLLAPRGLATLRAVSEMSGKDASGTSPQRSPPRDDPLGGTRNKEKVDRPHSVGSVRGRAVSPASGSDSEGSETASASVKLPPAQHKERQRPATQQGHYSSGGEQRRSRGVGMDEPRGVDMTPTLVGHDPESTTMYTGRARSNRGRLHNERFDVLKIVTSPPKASPYTQKLKNIVSSGQKNAHRAGQRGSPAGGGVEAELFPAASGARPRTTPH